MTTLSHLAGAKRQPAVLCESCTTNGGGYKYNYTLAPSTGGTSQVAYNDISQMLGSATSGGSPVFNNTTDIAVSSANAATYSYALTSMATGRTYSTGFTRPGTLPSNGTVQFTDTNGFVHTLTIAASSSTSVTNAFIDVNGTAWTVNVDTADGVNFSCTATAAGSAPATTTFALPATLTAARGIHRHPGLLAYAPTVGSDVENPIWNGERVAIKVCCYCMQVAADMAALISAMIATAGGIAAIFGAVPVAAVLGLIACVFAIIAAALALVKDLLCS
ncbi:MAG TPA: hypothetical protein VMD91_02905 [Candidatus Sulfotelmatobacter sp.]|nr:hypothetical protein [Candidatus Sulfotelmatobacter sp.]